MVGCLLERSQELFILCGDAIGRANALYVSDTVSLATHYHLRRSDSVEWFSSLPWLTANNYGLLLSCGEAS